MVSPMDVHGFEIHPAKSITPLGHRTYAYAGGTSQGESQSHGHPLAIPSTGHAHLDIWRWRRSLYGSLVVWMTVQQKQNSAIPYMDRRVLLLLDSHPDHQAAVEATPPPPNVQMCMFNCYFGAIPYTPQCTQAIACDSSV
jgi:hypothetical protein